MLARVNGVLVENRGIVSCDPQKVHQSSTSFAHDCFAPKRPRRIERTSQAKSNQRARIYVALAMTFVIAPLVALASEHRAEAPTIDATALQAGDDTSRQGDARFFRIFLTDGTSLACFGEYARVTGRIVFSLPLGHTSADTVPALQLVSLPEDRVDWARTEAYAESTRAAHYVATRAEDDYARLTNDVALAINDITLATDPASQLALAERVRGDVARWPADHYGYRAKDVQEILGLLDEAIAEIRVAAGGQRFDLTLAAGVSEPPPRMEVQAAPSLRDVIEQALIVAKASDSSEDRLALLGGASALLEVHANELPTEWAGATRALTRSSIELEMATERAYGRLSSTSVKRAKLLAGKADVRGVETLIRRVTERDATLGRARPQAMLALVASLNDALDAARRLRLARDQWELKRDTLRAYRLQVGVPLASLGRLRGALEQIRDLAGPAPQALVPLSTRLASVAGGLQGVTAPPELQPTHAALLSAHQLATSAVRLRRAAAESGVLATAKDAAAAAAGALMLLERSRGEIERALAPPELP
jgi:hypothetical protein